MPRPSSGSPVNKGKRRLSDSAIQLRDDFRQLWEQHVYWTRMTVISIANDLPDVEAVTNRLLRNVPDFASVFEQFYGSQIAAEFARLLREHLVIAAELVKAAKAGDNKAVANAKRRWYANADAISSFLSQINPNWPLESMRAMWYEHLDLTMAEAVARLNKSYAKDIALFNKIEDQALLMADSFAHGITVQFHL